MEEIWKDIECFEGLYQVSNLGRVKRVATGRVLKGCKDRGGYLLVGLYKQGSASKKLIHRLVAQAFIPNPEHKSEINHIDENKTNNMVSNLEWMTAKENSNHGKRNERVSKSNSIPIIAINLKTSEVQKYYGTNECARQLGLDPSNITHVLKGRVKQTKGYTFKYNGGYN